MVTNRDYVMTPRLFHRRQTLGLTNICRRCEKQVKIGDPVHTTAARGRRGTLKSKIYHKECWDSMFIDC